MVRKPLIDRQKCDGCGLCVSICQCRRLVVIDNVITVIDHDNCRGCTHWCTLCEAVCPMGAISCPCDIIIEEFDRSDNVSR